MISQDDDMDREVSDYDMRPMNTDVTDRDLYDELRKEARDIAAAEMEYRARMQEAERRRKEEAKKAQEAWSSTSRVIKPGIFFFPIMLAVLAIFDMPTGYYTFFKIVVLVEAIILVSMSMNGPVSRSAMITVPTIYMVVMAGIGIISFMNGGFSKDLWVALDITYCIMHSVLYFGLLDKAKGK